MTQLSSRQIRAIMQARANAEKSAEKVEREAAMLAFAKSGTDLFTQVVTTIPLTDRDESTSAYHSVTKVPFIHEGREYAVSVIVTDVARAEEKRVALEAEALAFLAETSAETLEAAGSEA